MRRANFALKLSRQPLMHPVKSMAIVRLPTVLMPDQATEVHEAPSTPTAVFGPGARVGVEIDEHVKIQGGGAMLVGGGRVRLLRERPSHDRTTTIGILQRLVDVSLPQARAEKLKDEAHWARELTWAAVERGHSELQGGVDYMDAPSLSLWLAGRLPLSPRVLSELIACTCPLSRMQDVVDAMRLLAEPGPRRERRGHRYRLRACEDDETWGVAVDKASEPAASTGNVGRA